MMLPTSRFEAFLERLLVPPVVNSPPLAGGNLVEPPTRRDDFRRVVAAIAIAAVGFFVPALGLAGVPADLWLPYAAAAIGAGLVVGGSFVATWNGTRWGSVAATLNVPVVAALGFLYAPYFHQLALLVALVVAAHAVVHGIGPALVAATLGGILVPLAIQAGQPINATDFVYAFIYLFGAGLMPWTAGLLARRRAIALREQLDLTVRTEREAVMVLARAAEAKDHVTGEHVIRVADIAAQLALRTGAGDAVADDIRFAAMLHDVGKLHLPDSVLLKPGALSPTEWELVKQHTIWGERILGSSAGFELARRVARSHHENFDGTGYPDGLRGEEIPFAARIVRLADVLDAMRQVRPYKPAWDLERCLTEIAAGAGSQFDPELTGDLLAMFEPSAMPLRAQLEPASAAIGAPPADLPPPVSPLQALDGILPSRWAGRARRRAGRFDRLPASR